MPDPTPKLPFEDELRRLILHCVNATGPFPKDDYTSRSIVDFLHQRWSREIADHSYSWTRVVEHPAIDSALQHKNGYPLDTVLARLDELADAENELKALMTPPEFVPHFKLHRDGTITPQQDDTPVWSTGPSPFALTVPESMVEEVEITREPSSWRAGGTGVPTSWSLDKLRELRDGALQEWIEVEAIIREVEKREKEEDPVEALADELWEAGRNNDDPPWHLASKGARARTIRQARHVLRKEASNE